MRRYLLLVVSAVLLCASLVGLLATNTIPTQRKEETALVQYAHEGTFDYLINLKPSTLYGSTPTSSYPAAIVRSLDFTFSYIPAEQGSGSASVDAVLENPGLWQKKIVLVPETTTMGDVALDFSLNIDQIRKLFDDTEKELNITSSEHSLSIEAHVTNSSGFFTQSLPITLTDRIIDVSNSLSYRRFSGASSFQYIVKLKPNNTYDTPTLEPPQVSGNSSLTLGPGQTVFWRLVDGMDVSFRYSFKANKPIENVTTDIQITASIAVPNLWFRTFPVLNASKNGNFVIDFPIDLVGYMKLFDLINTETGIPSDSSEVTVDAQLHTVGQSQFGPIDETYSQEMKGTIRGNVIDWDKELTKTQSGAIKQVTLVRNGSKYLGLSVDWAKNLTRALTVIFLLLLVFSLILYFRSRRTPRSLVNVEALRIRKKYKQRIAEAISQTPMENETLISLSSMESLITVADELGKPIIHQGPVTSEGQHAYHILDGTTRYQYLPPTGIPAQDNDIEKAG